MKKMLAFLVLVLFSLFVVGCGGNDVVKNVKPQSEKMEYFSSFEDEKKFMLKKGFEAVRKAGEEPDAWYTDQAHFNKGSSYSAYTGYISCKSGKLAYVHVQYDMQDTAMQHRRFKEMSNEEINKVPNSVISEVITYKSIPRVYAQSATIRDNFFRH